MSTDYFCQQKFDWVEIRPYDGFVSSCCQAAPHSIKRADIVGKPIGFFNYPEIIKERQMMLSNQRVPGCESCWKFEDQNLPSRRTNHGSTEKIYHDTFGSPKTVNIVISNTCNQTCIYCCKNFSHSWLNDIIKNGNYDLDGDSNRYQLNKQDYVLSKLSQKNLYQAPLKNIVLEQLEECENLEHIIFSGGEPFLDNSLVDMVSKFSDKKVTILTGLAVNPTRFLNRVDQLQQLKIKNINIVLSAENIKKLHEFNRYGSIYRDWWKNYSLVKSNFDYQFAAVVSNLTIFGLPDFLKLHSHEKIYFSMLSDPQHLMINLLDDDSKQRIKESLLEIDAMHDSIQGVINGLMLDPNLSQKANLKKYFYEFARRRNINTKIFPKSFHDWLENSL